MRTKAKDQIELTGGRRVALGEALTLGLLKLIKLTEHRHIAREVNGDLFWEVSAKLYASRWACWREDETSPTRDSH